MSGASWTGTLLGFGVLGGSVVGFGRSRVSSESEVRFR